MISNFLNPTVEKIIFENTLGKISIFHSILSYIENSQLKQLNSGNFSPQTSFQKIFKTFNQRIYQNYLKSQIDNFSNTTGIPRNIIIYLIIKLALSKLLESNHIFNVSDKNRYRSYFIELLRYNTQVRQRFTELPYNQENAPNLIQLHKGYALNRFRPEFEVEIPEIMNRIKKFLNQSKNPFIVNLRSDPNYLPDTLNICQKFFDNLSKLFGNELKLSKYQYRALSSLFKSVDPSLRKDHIITSDTGTGKTEAFIFPILIYLIATRKIKGTKAIIFYPRISLTDDQFLRFCKYLYVLNEIMRTNNEPLITIGIEHSKADPVQYKYKCPFCEIRGKIKYLSFSYWKKSFVAWCRDNNCELNPIGLDFVKFSREKNWKEFYDPDKFIPNILICTADSLHLRLMSGLYRHIFGVIWKCRNCNRLLTRGNKCSKRGCNSNLLDPLISDTSNIKKYNFEDLIHLPIFIVSDEIHLYIEHNGAHIKNLFIRIHKIIYEKSNLQPIKIGISATIKNPQSFGQILFNSKEVEVINPHKNELLITGREYYLFLLARKPGLVLSKGLKFGKTSQRGLSSLSAMIQTSFCSYHNLKNVVNKNRILLFIDSINTIAKFSRYLYHADSGLGLFLLRYPSAKYNFIKPKPFPMGSPNLNCPYKNIFASTPIFACGNIAPNKNIFSCPTFECGECWFIMSLMEPINIQAYSSAAGISKPYAHLANRAIRKLIKMTTDKKPESWDMRISTNALEVGFDHPELIGTFQYLSPKSPVNFIQRKGRGGRASEDMPISMITFSNSPIDLFYFKNSQLLTNPEENALYIADSNFIQNQHIISSILDFIAISTVKSSIPLKIYEDLNIQDLYDFIITNKKAVNNYVQSIFNKVSISFLSSYFDLFIRVLKKLNTSCKVRGSSNYKPFWYFISKNNWEKDPILNKSKPKIEIDWISLRSTSSNASYLELIWNQVKKYWEHQEIMVLFLPNLLSPYFLYSSEIQIPFTFIPVIGGGNLFVLTPDEKTEENIDFILTLFAPGSIKARWKYRLFGTNLNSLVENKVVIEQKDFELGENINFNKNFLPNEILTNSKINIHNLEIKKPLSIKLNKHETTDTFYLKPKTKEISLGKYSKKGFLLKKEPQGNPKFFRSIIDLASEELNKFIVIFKEKREIKREREVIDDIKKSPLFPLKLFFSFFKELVIQKIFFGTDLILYPKDNPITQIPYIFSRDKFEEIFGDLFLGFNHSTQAIKIDIHPNVFEQIYLLLRNQKPIFFWTELKFNYFFSKVAELIINEEGNPYLIKPLCECFKALETYMIVVNNSNLMEYFSKGNYKQFIKTFIGDKENRSLAPFFSISIAQEIQNFFKKHIQELISLLAAFYNDFNTDINFKLFLRDSFYHTLKHSMIRAFQNFCFLGLNGIRGMFPSKLRYPDIDKSKFYSSILFFDELEGGSGICETIINQINNNPSKFADKLREIPKCEISEQELIIIKLLNLPINIQNQMILKLKTNKIQDLANIINTTGISITQKQVKDWILIFQKIFLVEEYPFYMESARLYIELKKIITRMPTISDLLIFLDYKKPLKNPFANNLYQKYIEKNFSDLSSIAAKLFEIIPSCITSCPQCLEIENCEHIFPNKIISELTLYKQFFNYFY